MTFELREYSAAKIGQIWTPDDHEFLVSTLGRIDQTCIDIWNRIRIETREAPKRLDELLSLDPAPSRGNPDVLDLPFDEMPEGPDA
jgi:hypothetical protein